MNEDSTNMADDRHVRKAHSKRVRSMVGAGVAALALGLLIWAKLQLVVGVPRTAVATPEEVRSAAPAVQKAPTAAKPTRHTDLEVEPAPR